MRASHVALAAVLVAGLASPAWAQSGGYHVDETTGYKVRTPKDWQEMPLQTDERWIVAKFLSDREYVNKEDGWGFKPEMRVIIFPFEVTKNRGVKKTDEGKTTVFEIKNPYKDYKDYLQKNYSGGGWFVSLEKDQESKDVKWTLIEIKVEKLAYGGKKRLVAGVFHAGDADYVVQFEVLEDSYDKLRNLLYGCLKSFRFIPRKGALATPESGGIDLGKDEGEMTPTERKKYREEKQRVAFRRAVEKLPPGWDSFEYKGFYVLCHVDKKYARTVVDQAASVRSWCEKTFDYLGDEYVRQPIIRICANADEEQAYSDGSADAWGSSAREIVTHEDTGSGKMSWEFGWVNQMVFTGWIYDKAPDLAGAMPSWLSSGLSSFVSGAYVKGSRLEFKPDEWEKENLRNAERTHDLLPVQKLLTLAGDALWQKPAYRDEGTAFVRFLLDGPGRRMKSTRDFLQNYLLALKAIAKEAEEKQKKDAGKKDSEPKTEEEEDKEFRERQKRWKEQEEQVLKDALKRAVPDWSDSDWETVDKAFRSSL